MNRQILLSFITSPNTIEVGVFAIILLMLGIMTIIFLLYNNLRQQKKNNRLLLENEHKLNTITQSINGAVAVLKADSTLSVTFVNQGFFILTGIEPVPLDSSLSFIDFVHESDRVLLLHTIQQTKEENHLSLQLRLSQEEEYIPVLFNATISLDEKQHRLLYCVITDISEQVSILNKLELEQERYELILEKSDQMFFEIDIAASKITMASMFHERFGWTFPNTLPDNNIFEIFNLWHVHEEDADLLTESEYKALVELTESECTVRLKTINNRYKWCRISHYIMYSKDQTAVSVIGKVIDIDSEIREKLLLEKRAHTDELTGLLNKEAFFLFGVEKLSMHPHDIAIIFIDIDNFKSVNDLFGHMMGDEVLREVASKIRAAFSQEDYLSRFGGDEFCIMACHIKEELLVEKLDWLLENLNITYTNERHKVSISPSIGVIYGTFFDQNLETLLEYADKALYSVKEKGKNSYSFYQFPLD